MAEGHDDKDGLGVPLEDDDEQLDTLLLDETVDVDETVPHDDNEEVPDIEKLLVTVTVLDNVLDTDTDELGDEVDESDVESDSEVDDVADILAELHVVGLPGSEELTVEVVVPVTQPLDVDETDID